MGTMTHNSEPDIWEAVTTADLIRTECETIAGMLLEKNRAYGNSALNPVRVFSTADPVEQLRVRIDDKLSRLARGSGDGEYTILDLIGYLVLLRIATRGSAQLFGNPEQLPPEPVGNPDTLPLSIGRDDPEPAVGSVVIDDDSECVFGRLSDGWCTPGDTQRYGYRTLGFPLTLIHDGASR